MATWLKKTMGGGRGNSAGSAAGPTIQLVADRTERGPDLIHHLQPSEIVWTRESFSASETQTWYLDVVDEAGGAPQRGDAFLFMQVVYSTVGLGAQVQVTVRYRRFSTGTDMMVTQSFSGSPGTFQVSSDKTSASLPAGALSIAQEPLDLPHQSGAGSSLPPGLKFTVSAKVADKLAVEFVFESRTPAVQIKDGRTQIGPDVGYVCQKFAPTGTFSGYIEFAPADSIGGSKSATDRQRHQLSGRGLFVHANLGAKPHLIASRWDFMSYQFTHPPVESSGNTESSDKKPVQHGALIMCQFQPPTGSTPPDPCNQCILVLNDRVVAVTTDAVIEVTQTTPCPVSQYPLPTHEVMHASFDSNSESTVATSQLQLQFPNISRLLARVDVLGELPYVVRKVLQVLVAKPFCYLFLEPCRGQCTFNGQTVQMDGVAYLEATFVNP